MLSALSIKVPLANSCIRSQSTSPAILHLDAGGGAVHSINSGHWAHPEKNLLQWFLENTVRPELDGQADGEGIGAPQTGMYFTE